ncbi:coiled-coil domain-containing protein [Sulfitobacter dubius]|uniref:hypothetical protein n=1 Tax=Sulfitobacter dubius TaxID=218673 RepID=UPI0029422222|nr:hypothetical protein [Sulfitobacter dubius]WOI30039.1 hypothetical protein R1T39_04870 [Sulfitobacter dubius]
MAEVETALILRLEASLAKFEKQMERARKAGVDSATRTEKQFAASNRKMAQTAEASAQTIGKEMDRLRAKYDPLFAASKRYETELSELNRAQKVGALNTQQYDAALERLNAEYMRATGSAQRLAGTTRGMGGGIQNVAYQIGDFATQVGAGTAASMALGQQLPQLLGGFGVLGAVLGAVVAVAVPLTAALFLTGEEVESLDDKITDLRAAVQDYRSAVESATVPTADIAEKYGTATGAARDFLQALRDISQSTALTELEDTTRALSRQFGTFEDKALGGLQQMQGVTNLNETLKTMRSELGLSEDEARSVATALEALGQARGPKDVASAAQDVLTALEDALGPISEMDGGAKALAEKIAEAGLEARSLQGGMDGAAGSISGAASQAGRLADELGRAVNNAVNLAAQGISDVKRAKIEYDYRDDPVGRAGAIAAAQVDASPLASGADPSSRAIYAKNRDIAIESARTAEEYRQAVIKWRKAQSDAAKANTKTSTAKGGKAGRSKREEAGLFEASDKELESIERQIEMIGMTQSEIAGLTAKYKLLDEAKERGLNLDARQAATGETLREQIDRQAASIGDLTEKYEQARERAAFFEGVQQDLKDGFIDAIVEGESLAGVLENLAKSLAKAALQAMLFNEGPFASGSGTGWLGGGGKGGLLGGAIIPGILHSGGTAGKDGYGHGRSVSPALFNGAPRYHKGGIAGLRPNEVPAILERGERVIPNGQTGSAGGSGGVVRVIVEEGPMFASRVRTEATGVAVEVTRKGIQQNTRAQADNKYLKGGR